MDFAQDPDEKRMSGLAEVMQWLVWIGLGILLIALVALLIRMFLGPASLRPGVIGLAATRDGVASDADRVERLPFPVQRPQTDLLGEARRHYEAGDYVEAIIYLFSHQLVYLDKHDLVRLAKGKTNRQYLREMKSHRGIVRILSDTMLAFEDVFFGRHDLDRVPFRGMLESVGSISSRRTKWPDDIRLTR